MKALAIFRTRDIDGRPARSACVHVRVRVESSLYELPYFVILWQVGGVVVVVVVVKWQDHQ